MKKLVAISLLFMVISGCYGINDFRANHYQLHKDSGYDCEKYDDNATKTKLPL